MDRRNNKAPDKDMEKPKAYKSSIDPKKPQPSMKIDTRQTQYKTAKAIDFNNKVKEYNPNNDYYKTSFWDTPKRKMVQQQPKKEKPKPIPVPKPQPKPKSQPPRRAPPSPKRLNNGLQALPQANFNSKRAPMARPQPRPEEPHRLPRTPPPTGPESPQYPVQHFEPEPEPEADWASPPPVQMEQWGEPMKVIPDLNPRPPPVQKGNEFSTGPSTVGSMSRMMAMFT